MGEWSSQSLRHLLQLAGRSSDKLGIMTNFVQKICTKILGLVAQRKPRPSDHPNKQAFDDRQEWDRAWSAQSHRFLNTPLKTMLSIDVPFGEVVSATISEDPPEFSHRISVRSEACPVCGQSTVNAARLAAHVHPKFENGNRSISFGVWVHVECYERCSDTGNPAPIPW
jgi:hypothetical protein